MGKKKRTLDFEYDFDFNLIGISCHIKDYRFCFELNKALGTRLEKTDDIVLPLKDGASSHFSTYHHAGEYENLYYVFSNKNSENLLMSDLKQWDYLFLIAGAQRELEAERILHKLQAMPKVLLASSVEPRKLKAAEVFLYYIQ